MSAERQFSERELVEAKRKAYEDGMVRGSAREFRKLADVQQAAAEAFPFPPPAVFVGGRWYRLRDGVLEYKRGSRDGAGWDRASLQPEDVQYLAAFIANVHDGDAE